MADLPTGTVTFLFTDVEGSTRLLHEFGDEYAEVLAAHRRALRDAFARHGGVEVDTQGDAFFFAFVKATDALAAAAEGRDALTSGPIRVRMGVHTGEPTVTGEGYVGIDVHRAARVAAAGHGGQILVSQSTRDLAGADALRDLGEHRLKDLAAPERIYQLGEGDFPPLKSLNNSNLPLPSEPLLGRKKELADVLQMLRDSVRLVTVTGPGGSGKTRFALEAGSELIESFRDGVWWVGLAPVRDKSLVLSAIGASIGAKDLHVELNGKELLLLLDNFEHVVDAASAVAELQRTCPGVAAIVTSREPLHIAGEHEYPLAPLPESPAVELFRQRGEAVAPGFDADYASLVEICDRLDRLPLAIELAAARVKTLTVDELVRRLEQRLPLLTSRRRDVEERQRTLRSTIEWSFELLDEVERTGFAALSVFAGSFTAEAAEAVCQVDLDALESLVDKSLLHRREDGRFFMLETIREYAASVLEDEALRDRHLDYYVRLIVETDDMLTGDQQEEALAAFVREEGNVRAALEFACRSGDAERALMLAGSSCRFWLRRTQIREAMAWYEQAFAVDGSASARARGRALYGLGEMKRATGAFAEARELLEQSIPLLREAEPNERWIFSSMNHLANAFLDAGEFARARVLYEEILALTRAAGSVRGVAIVSGNLGFLALQERRYDEAERWLREGLELDHQTGNVHGLIITLENLALLALLRGNGAEARSTLRECLVRLQSLQSEGGAFEVLVLAAAFISRDDPRTSVRLQSAGRTLATVRSYELSGPERNVADEALAESKAALGEDAFADEWRAGAQLELDAAVELALQSLD